MRASANPAARGTPDEAAGGGGATPAAVRPEYRVEALAKGLRILSLFTENRPTWRVSGIAPAVGIPLPTVYRVVMTLTAEGYLDHLPGGDYRPGVAVLSLGRAALGSLDLVQVATPKLRELADATRETVNLAVLTADRVLYLVRLRNSDLVTANIRVGSTLPAVRTSIGKLLLAYLDEDDLTSRIDTDSFAGNAGPNAKQTLDELHGELSRIRADGWALQDQELAGASFGRRAGPGRRRCGDRRREHRGARARLVHPAHRPRAQAPARQDLRRHLPPARSQRVLRTAAAAGADTASGADQRRSLCSPVGRPARPFTNCASPG